MRFVVSPTKRIEYLTGPQEAMLPVYRDWWTAIGLCTAPADRARAEAAMVRAYAAAHLAPPRFVWCDSPLSGGLTAAIVFSPQPKTAVGASVWASVRDSVRASVWASVRASVGASVGASGYGQQDAGWLAFYDFFREVCGLSAHTEKLQGLTDYSKHAGWFLPHENICWVSERHSILRRDDRGRLHSVEGPAVMYPDGWAIYAVHGVRVPRDIIEKPETLTVKRIEAETNTEVRRVMIERMGYERYILESGAQMIHSDATGMLYRKELPGDEALVVVHVINSTPEPDGYSKKYTLRVDPECRPLLAGGQKGSPQAMTAHNAVASTFGLRGDEYAPLIET